MRTRLALLLVTLGAGACERDPILTPDRKAVQFIALDAGSNQVHMIDEIRGTSWSIDIPSGANDLSRWNDDEILISHASGASRIDIATGEVVWEINTYTGITSAQQLDGGAVLLAGQYGQQVTLFNIDRFGEQTGERTLSGYLYTRLIRQTEADSIVFTTGEPWQIVELDGFTNPIWGASLPSLAFQVERTADNTTQVSTTTDLRILEIDYNRSTVRTWSGGAEAEEYGLVEFRGFSMLDDLMFVANWVGADGLPDDAHVVALNDNSEVVWSWEDHDVALAVCCPSRPSSQNDGGAFAPQAVEPSA